jgi:hypothetical protein
VQDLAAVTSVFTRLEAVLSRLAGQFRSMPESKLHGRLRDGRSRAVAGHELAERLALAAQGLEDRCASAAPVWRRLPFEGPFVVGDQIGVTGHDLLVACERAVMRDGDGDGGEVGGDEDRQTGAVWVWAAPGMAGTADERVRLEAVLESVLGAAEELARVL